MYFGQMGLAKYIWCIGMLLSYPASSQFIESFTDGELANNPVWQGDLLLFSVSSGKLRLQAPPVSGSATLATPNAAILQGSWEFSVQLDFTPSSANYVKLFLTADQPSLQSGYMVKIGGSTREVSLYIQTPAGEQKLIDGVDDRVNQPVVNLSVRVTRDASGNWALYSDSGMTGAYVQEGTASDLTILASAWFGIQCVYTSTRSDKFWFDDFVVNGTVVPDTSPPVMPAWKSVLISEILADPTPQIGLPSVEFIEIYNPGTLPFDLTGWTLTDGSSIGTFPASVLLPGEFKIVTANSSVALFNGRPVGLVNFPSLNNSGDHLRLFARGEVLIDSVAFDLGWYRDEDKQEGGWSLELIDPRNPCGEEDNWTASEDVHGGTPGLTNSVQAEKPDLTPPTLVQVYARDSVTIMIAANESMHLDSPIDVMIHLAPKVDVKATGFADPSRRNLQVVLDAPLQKRTAYEISIEDLRDCSGNLMEPATRVIGLTEESDSLDLRLSEILFNPRNGGVDFVEIFNASEKFIDLSTLTLGNGEENVSISPCVMVPGSQIAVTEQPDVVNNQYPLSSVGDKLKAPLPSLPDDRGQVILKNHGRIIDQLIYDHSSHSPLLRDEEGVSLERIDMSGLTQEPANWQSASAGSGYATPGLRNSQRRDGPNTSEDVRVEPEIFSPGANTFDFVQIRYHFDQPGRVGNVRILNSQGAVVKDIANNELLGMEGSFRWDGDREDGRKSSLGYYVVWMETFDPAGGVVTFRRRVVVASR